MHVQNRKCAFSALHDTVVDLHLPVPDKWIDSLFPEVRRILQCVKAKNARLRSANPQAEDRVSDRAAEGFLQTVLYAGICFWQNLPFRTERYVQHNRTCLRTWTERQMIRMSAMSGVTCRYGMSHILHRLPAVASIMITQEYSHFAKQVWSSHNKANKQAELDVSAGMGDILQDMQACLKQLCGGAAVGEPEAVARLIAEKISATNISSSAADAQEDSVRGEFTRSGSSTQHLLQNQSTPKAASSKHPRCIIPLAASILSCWLGKSGALALHTAPLLRGCWRPRHTSICHWAGAILTCTRRTGTCLSSSSCSSMLELLLHRLST